MKKLRHKCKVTLSLFVTMLLVIGSVTASLATDENSSAKAYSATLTEDQITLTLNAVVNGDLPDDTKLTVKKVISNESEYKGLEKKLSNQATEDHYINNGSSIYDYAFVSENKEVTPTGDVTLTMTYSQAYAPSGATNEDEVSLFKLSSPVVNLAKDTKTKITTANQSNKVTQISYTTNSLDPIALVYREKKQSVSKVNVHYVNAKDTSKELADVKTISGSELSGEMSLDNLSKALVNTDNYTYTYQKAAIDKADGTPIQGLKAEKKDDVTKLYYITSGSKDYTPYKGEGESYEVNVYLLYDVTEKVKEDTSKKEETSKTEATTSETKVAEEASKSESTTSKTKATEETQKSTTTSENNKKTEQQKVEMPAASFTASTSKLKISVTASENAFPKGTTMKAKEISASTAKSIAKEKMKDVKDAIGADITFYYQGKEIEPANNKNVTVKMELKEALEGKNFQVFHKKDSGDVEKVDADANIKDKKVVFKTKSFSIYVVGSEEINTYNFYDAKGNVMADYTQHVAKGDTLDKPDTTPEKDGYKFIGWATTQNASEANFDDFGHKFSESDIDGQTHNIYPVFVKVHYVFFMSSSSDNDTSKVVATKEILEGDELTQSEIDNVQLGLSSDKSNEGWYYDKEHKNKISSSIAFSDENFDTHGNLKIYPNIVNGYYITFESNGGNYIKPLFVAGNTTVDTSQFASTTKKGYYFKYWSISKNGNEEYTGGEKLEKGITLYAVYTPRNDTTYTIVYWKQSVDDDVKAADAQKTYEVADTEQKKGTTDSALNITYDMKNEYSKTYFTYNSNNTETSTRPTKIDGSGETVLNIYYDRNPITIEFYKKGDIGSITRYSNGTGKAKNYTLEDSYTGLYGAKFNNWPKGENGVAKAAYCYFGNGTTASGTIRGLSFLDSFLLPQEGTTVIKLYADDKTTGTTIEFKKETLTDGQYSDDYKYPTGAAQFYFTNKYTGFTVHSYQREYEYNDRYTWVEPEKIIEKQGNDYGSVSLTFTSYGYGYAHYYTKLIIYFSRNSYDLKFFSNGKELTDYSKKVKYEADISEYNYTPTSDDDHYTFGGWYKDEACTDPFEFEKDGKHTLMPAANINLYAKWIPKTYNVRVHNIDGDSTEPMGIVAETVNYLEKIDQSKLPTVYDNANKTIVAGDSGHKYTVPEKSEWIGWATIDNEGNYIPFNFDEKITQDIDLYPYVIGSEKYRVIYDVDGYSTDTGRDVIIDGKKYGSGSYADVKTTFDDNGEELVTPPKGKMFKDWQVYIQNGENKYKETDQHVSPREKLKVTNNMLLVPCFVDIPKKVKIIYYNEKKEKVGESTEVVNGGEVDLAKESIITDKPSYDGIDVEFEGWTTADGSQTFEASSDTKTTKVNINRLECEIEDDCYVNKLYAKYKYTLSLTITKHVTGNQGDRTKAFEFAVNVGNIQSNTTVTLDKSHAESDNNPESLTVDNGKINPTITLKNDDSITLKFESNKCQDIQKLSCSVEETNSSTYDASYTVDGGTSTTGNKVEFTSLQKSHAIVFTNDKNGSIPTGIEKNVVITLPLIIAGIGFVLKMLKKRNEVE